ncbi:hypothetical protein FQA47_015611 [Oryzias melastigma]|uniref:Uncharacterized protein n=1 Tax=Oryzias melastigma TaxID=30732 RepID=A0A834C487_ORYME|nr:hypothetical protein FQA47_015611 [Oryzias melastigma]
MGCGGRGDSKPTRPKTEKPKKIHFATQASREQAEMRGRGPPAAGSTPSSQLQVCSELLEWCGGAPRFIQKEAAAVQTHTNTADTGTPTLKSSTCNKGGVERETTGGGGSSGPFFQTLIHSQSPAEPAHILWILSATTMGFSLRILAAASAL